MVMTGFSIALDAFHGIQLWGELFEVPLMAAMFLAMVWHARRRVDAQRIAEGRAEEHRSLLERQERFIHDASHELRTPVTIARGHLELLQSATETQPEVEVALDELSRMDAIVARLLVLAVADDPDFLQTADIELEPLLEDVFMRWSGLAPRAWRLGPLASGRLHVDADRLRAPWMCCWRRGQNTPPGSAIELRATPQGRDEVVIEVGTRTAGCPGGASRIFGRFAQATRRARCLGGVGLDTISATRQARRQLRRDQYRCGFDLRPARLHPRADARTS
jgi:signal transduction histidine kinase